MTLAQEIERKKKEWVLEAKREGKQEDALAMLKKGFSLEVIGEITNLPLAEIKMLEEQRV